MKPIVFSHFNEKNFQSAYLSFADGVDRCTKFFTYQLTDHLPNTRVTFTDNITYNATGTAPNITFSASARIQVNSYLNYYAYGMPKSPNGDYQGGAAAFFCKEITPFRFGFNTQERSDEVAGFLNHNIAQFWEYDTRISFRWNIDQVERIGISGYDCFNANPIVFNDVRGDKPAKLENGNVAYRGKSAASNWLRANVRTLFTRKRVTRDHEEDVNFSLEDKDNVSSVEQGNSDVMGDAAYPVPDSQNPMQIIPGPRNIYATATQLGARPIWHPVYTSYPKRITSGAVHDQYGRKVFKSIFGENYDTNKFINACVNGVSIALLGAGVSVKTEFIIKLGSHKGKGITASASSLLTFLSKERYWDKPM